MTHMHPAHPTSPMKRGAPLPETDDEYIGKLMLGDVVAEMRRASVELMHAAARHRKAWTKMRAYRKARDKEAEQTGMPAYLDSDAKWKVITGDVAWWRAEMDAQAATVTALTTMLNNPKHAGIIGNGGA